MKLIGYMDSPYVRRVAVMAQFFGVDYEHVELSVFRDFDAFRKINPLVKVPTWVCDDGQVLVESGLIIDYLESVTGSDRMMPSDEAGYIRALNIIGTAMVASEKLVQLVYELKHRPEDKQHPPFIDRVQSQLDGALERLESEVGTSTEWIFGQHIFEPDISAAIAWRFSQLQFPDRAPADRYPGLVELSSRAEALPEFQACPIG
jgi:glutathione S-transferase